jgi:hypothetical protein
MPSLPGEDFGTAASNPSYHKHLAKTTENYCQEAISLVSEVPTLYGPERVFVSLSFSPASSANARFSQPSRI